MNPASNESHGINLPPPIAEQSAQQNGKYEVPASMPEQANVGAEQQPQSIPQTTQMYAPMPTPTTLQAAQTVVPATTQVVVPTAVDDGDLIEKEWVTKAKQIVEANRDDPFKQSEELTVFKADYMQKRYNKSIKVSK